MRESQQAHLLSQYVESLKHNPDATPPADLDEEMAIFAKQLVESQNHRRARVWSQVLAEVKHDSTAGGRLFDEPTTMNDPHVFTEYRTPPYTQTQKKRQTFPLTMIAAMLVVVLGIAVMIAIRNLPHQEEDKPFAAQIHHNQETTLTPNPTLVATSTPMRTPFATIDLQVVNAGVLDSERIEIVNNGAVVNLFGWTLRDMYGNAYSFGDVQLLPNGTLNVHTANGTPDTGHLYWGLDESLFANDRQNSIVLANEEGDVAMSVGVTALDLQPTTVPTMTPPQLCNVQTTQSELVLFSSPEAGDSTLRSTILPAEVVAQVFEIIGDEDGELWYHIRANVESNTIVGWVNAENVQTIGERCPSLNMPLVVTAVPDGRSEATVPPPGEEDLTELMSGFDYLPVVIAGMDIPEATQITENMVAIVYMPVATVQDMVSRNGTAISGMGTFREAIRIAREDIPRWQPIFMSQIVTITGN